MSDGNRDAEPQAGEPSPAVDAPVRPLRQEQEQASEEITEVAPGILRLQLPIALPGLGHVNTYAIEDGDGFALVDPGLPGEPSWKALLASGWTAPASRCTASTT